MGGRSAFIDVDLGDFTFKDGGKQYNAVGVVSGVKVLVQTKKGSIGLPLFSHSAMTTYAIVQGNILKQVAFYGEDHKQLITVDLMHKHHGISPHKHYKMMHDDDGIPLTNGEKALVKAIKKELNLV